MSISIRKGIRSDVDHLEILYDTINDHMEKGINYCGWKKGVYPTRNEAIRGIEESN